jgi:hypothetical protein
MVYFRNIYSKKYISTLEFFTVFCTSLGKCFVKWRAWAFLGFTLLCFQWRLRRHYETGCVRNSSGKCASSSYIWWLCFCEGQKYEWPNISQVWWVSLTAWNTASLPGRVASTMEKWAIVICMFMLTHRASRTSVHCSCNTREGHSQTCMRAVWPPWHTF